MAKRANRGVVMLRLLALAVVFVAPLMLLVADNLSRLKFDALVAEIEGMGGTVTYLRDDSETIERIWAIVRGRDPHLDRIYIISLADCNINDQWMRRCRPLREVKSLYLHETSVTYAGIAHIAGMTKLETLSLCDTPVTDEALSHLSNMEDLGLLDLSGTRVVGWGLRHLCGKRNLKSLCLNDISTLDPTQLDGLACIPSLRSLELRGQQIDDRAMLHVARMPAIKWLDISESNVGNAGLAALESLSGRLEHLWLYGTRLTDEGTEALVTLEPRIVIVPLGVSEEAVHELKRRMATSVVGSEAENKALAAEHGFPWLSD